MIQESQLLLYCVLEQPHSELPGSGVDEQPVGSLQVERLTVLYSRFPSSRDLDQNDALRFHAVLKSVFDHQAIVPFRFPTFLATESELRDHLGEKRAKYAADLARLRDFVQMELRISGSEEQPPAASGKDYLEAKLQQSRRLQQAAHEARESSADLISDIKERPTAEGVRLYALTKRQDVASFRGRIHGLRVPAPLRILVSGPWPATEFLHD